MAPAAPARADRLPRCGRVLLKAGPERDTLAVLVVLGVRADGKQELLAIVEGYRDDTAGGAEMLRDVKARGLTAAPRVAVADGALGLWAALDQGYPTTRHARYWTRRALTLCAKLPQRLHPRARTALHERVTAPTRAACRARREAYAAELRGQGYPEVATGLARDWDDFTTFYECPQEHGRHLRTSKPIESVFAGVRLRTDATKRLRVRGNALYLTFKLVRRLSANWRIVDGPNQLTLRLLGPRYVDGRLLAAPPTPEADAA